MIICCSFFSLNNRQENTFEHSTNRPLHTRPLLTRTPSLTHSLTYSHTYSESSANTSHGKGKAPQTTVSDSCDPEASDDEPPAAARANGKRTWGGVALQYPSRKRCVG